ncbi:MAG: S41 family peptidase [Candidatus Saccharimonadales bacterium]
MKQPQPLYQPIHNSVKTPRRRRFAFLKVVLTIAILFFFFMFGIFVGNGRIVTRLHPLSQENKTLPAKLDYSSVESLYETIKTNYDGKLDKSKFLDGLKSGLTQATGDPYTVYLSPSEAKLFSDQLNGTFTGVGAELGKDDKGNLIVISPISGFPADKAGLKAKDIIAQINGQTTAGLTIDEAVSKIRGPKDTSVKLDIIRDQSQQISLTIVRDNIKVSSVKSQILEGNIGYLQITQFSEDTTLLAQQAAQQFKDAHVKGVILDLRGDPGGLLSTAVSVSSLWLQAGKTVLLEKRDDVVDNTYKATGGDILNGIPTAILMDGGSASASEITAGALRDNGVATIIGEKSFGKGSVQQIINLGDGSELKVTIAHWFTPSGKSINKTGIKPDQTVKANSDDIKAGKDAQKQAATDYINSK